MCVTVCALSRPAGEEGDHPRSVLCHWSAFSHPPQYPGTPHLSPCEVMADLSMGSSYCSQSSSFPSSLEAWFWYTYSPWVPPYSMSSSTGARYCSTWVRVPEHGPMWSKYFCRKKGEWNFTKECFKFWNGFNTLDPRVLSSDNALMDSLMTIMFFFLYTRSLS